MNSLRRTILWLALSLVAYGGLGAPPAPAYDMDCKVILCLAGGLPSGCADARSYMLNRLRKIPPKPPFGFCAMGGHSGTRVAQGREPYLPCGDEFETVTPNCDRGETCRPMCVAYRDDYAAARTLAAHTTLPKCGAETRSTPTDPRDSCVVVAVPDREDGDLDFQIRYRAERRAKPNWIQLHIDDSDSASYSSERFWWSRRPVLLESN